MKNTKFEQVNTAEIGNFVLSTLQSESINESIISRYFQTMNAGEFHLTAELFGENGVMYTPYGEAIVGKETIFNYLKKEAQDIKVYPRQTITGKIKSDNCRFQATGKVKTPLFGVNALWDFALGKNKEIISAKIKLLASSKELLFAG
ncbi:MAG: nuclear transport factor 2 family protein [Mastigocoleus sp. MO_167.B18]|uniref:ketosteroid isomerase family protein n=1 Tax=Mastigocoleus sp. MO_188.B34 TaxID=3036635 RepID=UPI00263A2BE5|nr:ketosteroid isomerase family protein [Mastigocoleus sp. MO_188.B34]MDJ0695018.1 nuclear transport factor 2 family protein [Mastigocoleus sp. MO_188.B34]MDJ0773335.1 nuclear transport factor 2 family protein [Mastigocoleus sp. MO_167.B18]